MRLYFYADEADIQSLLLRCSSLKDHKYTPSHWFDSVDAPSFSSLEEFAEDVENNTEVRMYFATPIDYKIITQGILKTGGKNIGKIIHSMNHGLSPDSVRIFFSRIPPENTVLRSTIDGFCETKESKRIFRELRALVTSHSTKIGDDWIMEGAMKKLKENYRLAPDLSYEPEYDVNL